MTAAVKKKRRVNMKRTKRIWAAALIMALCLLNGAAFAEGEEYYWHSKSTEENTKTYYQRSVHRICEGGFIPAIYNIVDGAGKQYDVYCCDFETGILASGERIAYRRLTLENSGYYLPEAASKIRAIALNSYPVLTLEEMKARMSAAGYTLNESVSEEQLLSGTQRAIWQYSNNGPVKEQAVYKYSLRITDGYADVIKAPEGKYEESGGKCYNEINENVQKVYNYLMSLNGKEASPGGIVLNGVQAAPLSTGTSGTADVLLKFKLENDRHGGITLNEKDDLTLAANGKTFPSREWRDEGNGEYSVTLQGVKAGENIDVTISGKQYLAEDAYFYEPVGGKDAAQCFVGVAEGSTPVFARGSFRIDEKTERLAYLSVKKTSNMPGTYKFSVYKAENDTKELINTVEITTAEANTCVASEKILLPAGTYIVEEEDAIKAGYTLTVTVDGNNKYIVNSEKVENPSVQVTLQGNGDAEVKIEFDNCYKEIPSSFGFKKTDEHDAGVKGAVFALFKDEDCKEPTAYKQTSDSNGDVKFPLIPVGIYYMKETAAPYGYYLNKEVFKIEVLVQEASGTDNVAIYRKDAQDQWVKVEGSLEVENSRKPENHYTPEEPVPAIVVMPKTGDGSVLLSAAGLLLAAAAVCGLKRRIRG
jgi:TQXA domain-containing protein/LPXTG-motif cell wall-anchored protein